MGSTASGRVISVGPPGHGRLRSVHAVRPVWHRFGITTDACIAPGLRPTASGGGRSGRPSPRCRIVWEFLASINLVRLDPPRWSRYDGPRSIDTPRAERDGHGPTTFAPGGMWISTPMAAAWTRGRNRGTGRISDADSARMGPAMARGDEARAVAALEKLGAKVYRDGTRAGEPVIGVDLDETEVNDAALASLEAFPHLRSLSIDETPITDAGLVHLERLNQLADLSLDHTSIGDAGVAHLRRLVSLRKLTLVHCEITDGGLAHLKDLQRLETLSLIGTKITDAGLEHLEGLQRLEWLLLDGNAITDAGLVHLKGLRNLEYLLLNKTAVTDEGLRQLTGLKELEMLSLHGTAVTDAGVEALQKVLRKAKIYH